MVSLRKSSYGGVDIFINGAPEECICCISSNTIQHYYDIFSCHGNPMNRKAVMGHNVAIISALADATLLEITSLNLAKKKTITLLQLFLFNTKQNLGTNDHFKEYNIF